MRAIEGLIRLVRRCRRMVRPLARRLLGRVAVIQSGVGKDLRFDIGPTTEFFLTGEYERPVQEALASLLHAGDVFYDIGANIGFFSLLAARMVGTDGVVYAFEPVPENALMVKWNKHLNGLTNIDVRTIAISRESKRTDLLLSRYAGGAVLLGAGTPPDLSGRIAVQTYSIDDLVELRRIRRPHAVKIDVEGGETDVLRGMAATIKEWRPSILLEVDGGTEQECSEKLNACTAFLHGVQYRCDLLAGSYRDGAWYVRHVVALPQSA